MGKLGLTPKEAGLKNSRHFLVLTVNYPKTSFKMVDQTTNGDWNKLGIFLVRALMHSYNSLKDKLQRLFTE